MKQKWIACLAIFTLTISFFLPTSTFATTNNQNAINEKLGVPIIVYGSSLSDAEKEIVKTALRVEQEPEFDEITVSGQDLVNYIKDSNSSSRMYSSAKITRQDEGKGLIISIVTPENITQVTAEMYANAMLTSLVLRMQL